MMADRDRNRRRRRRRPSEAGFGLAVLMMVLAIVTVWMTNSVLCAGYGILAAASARDRLAARMAAVERAGGQVPAGTGGAVFPEAPTEGFRDYLVRDRESGALEVIAEGDLPRAGDVVSCASARAGRRRDLPRAGDVVLRQWKLSAAAGGGRVFEVSTVVLDAATREPRPGPAGAEFRFSQVVE